MKYAIVKCAGSNQGKVKSVHRGFDAAMKAQPIGYYALCVVKDSIKAGQIVNVEETKWKPRFSK